MKTIIEVKSKGNGLSSNAGKDAYPLHKTLAENGAVATKYGTNGLMTGKGKRK